MGTRLGLGLGTKNPVHPGDGRMKERLIRKWAWNGFCIGLDVFNNTSLSHTLSLSLTPLLATTIYRCDDTRSLGFPSSHPLLGCETKGSCHLDRVFFCRGVFIREKRALVGRYYVDLERILHRLLLLFFWYLFSCFFLFTRLLSCLDVTKWLFKEKSTGLLASQNLSIVVSR
jgi:hypothetical protein